MNNKYVISEKAMDFLIWFPFVIFWNHSMTVQMTDEIGMLDKLRDTKSKITDETLEDTDVQNFCIFLVDIFQAYCGGHENIFVTMRMTIAMVLLYIVFHTHPSSLYLSINRCPQYTQTDQNDKVFNHKNRKRPPSNKK